jgi:NAD(P)-dependent dehydrogenase (short-subunit alcohol dehydrogenase family)
MDLRWSARCLEDGAQVALVDMDPLRLDSVVRFVRGTVVAVVCDVSESGSVRRRTSRSRSSSGPVDILVNNAACSPTTRRGHRRRGVAARARR